MKIHASIAIAVFFLSSAIFAAPVRIGAVYATSGVQAALDEPSWRGAQAAAAAAKAAAGGIELVRVPYDSTPASAAAAVRASLAKDPSIAAFIGVSDSDVALAAGREVVRSGKVFITSGATSPLLPRQLGPRFFLACFGDNVQAAAAAEWLLGAKKARKVCLFHDGTKIYTRLLKRYFEEAFTGGGGTVIESLSFRPGEPAGIPATLGRFDAVYLAAESAGDAQKVIAKLRAAGFKGPIIGGDGYDNPDAWEGSGISEGVYFTTHAFPAKGDGAAGPVILASLRGAYKGGNPDAFGGLGFDALRLLLASLGGSPDGLAQRLQNASPLAGVTGPIAYRKGSRVPAKPVAIVDAKMPRQVLSQITPARVPSP